MKSILFLTLVAWSILSQANSEYPVEYSSLMTSSHLTKEQFPAALLDDWVVLRSSEEDKAEFFHKELQLSAGTIAIAGTTSEMTFVAALTGSVSTSDAAEVAEAGNVLLLGHSYSSGVQVKPFDAKDFSERLRRLGSEELSEKLNPVIQEQESKIFWGLLRPSKINLNKPYNAAFEEGRRKYTLHPTLIGVKSSSQSVEELAANTASAFVSAMHAGDVESTAALISPLMFLEEGRTPYSNDDWLGRRLLFARTLCDKAKSKEISQVRADDRADSEMGVFLFVMEEKEYLMKLHMFDGSLFVKEIAQRNL